MMDRSDIVLPATAPDFILTRRFDAPRALVWKCWTEPSHLARWWAPKSFTCPVCQVDARIGGQFRIVMRGPDGTEYPMSGTFRDIVPMELIVKEDDTSEHPEEWHDAVDPDRKGQGRRKIELITTVTFEDDDNGTRVTIRTHFPSLRLRDNFARMGMTEGWSSSLGKLDDLLFAVGESDRSLRSTRFLKAPIEAVFACFSEPNHIGKWWGPNGFSTTTHEMDFRVGGVWRYTMHGPDGKDYPNHVTYTAIEPPTRIAYDHGVNEQHPDMFKATIDFVPEGNGTRVTLKLVLTDPQQREDMVAFGAVEGAWQTLSRLDEFLQSRN